MRIKLHHQQRLHDHRLSESLCCRNFEVWTNCPFCSVETLGCTSEVAPKLQEWSYWTLAESSKFPMKSICFVRQKKLPDECLGAIIPSIYCTFVSIEPLFRSPQKRKTETDRAGSRLTTLTWSQKYCKATKIAGSERWHPHWPCHKRNWPASL